MTDLPTFDPAGSLPFDDDANIVTPQKIGPSLLSAEFAYIGKALTLDSFASYVTGYNFGAIPPDFVCLHHTAIPSASWARYPSGSVWDADEQGLTALQIQAKRLRQLDSIMRYYQHTKGWDRGPHLFIDDLYVYLFTPMDTVGIHAGQGNSYRDSGQTLHYSIGIEVVGYYERTRWPAPVARNVAGAVASLHSRLKTFQYVDKPWAGGIGSHRMYNKPSCPGAAIVPSYYMPILKAAAEQPAPVPARYVALGVPIYEQESCEGELWGHLNQDEVVTIDKTYGNGTRAHLADDRGFIRLDPSVAALPSGGKT